MYFKNNFIFAETKPNYYEIKVITFLVYFIAQPEYDIVYCNQTSC